MNKPYAYVIRACGVFVRVLGLYVGDKVGDVGLLHPVALSLIVVDILHPAALS